MNHEWLIKFLEHEIADPNFIRYIKCFLKAGIMEEGKYWTTGKGVPQGGSVSPVLANVYLHYVLDTWFAESAVKRLRGEGHMVRYADDIVFCFQYERDVRDFYDALKARLAKSGLECRKTRAVL